MCKKIIPIFFFILLLYSFFIITKDFTVDELDYIHLNSIDHSGSYTRQLIEISHNTDHFPLFNFIKYSIWKFTKSPYFFRIFIFLILFFTMIIFLKILNIYKMDLWEKILYLICFSLHPLIIVNTVFSSEYIFSLFFLALFFFYLLKYKKNNVKRYIFLSFIFFFIAILTNYLTLICGFLILLHFFRDKKKFIFLFLFLTSIFMFILIFNIFSKTDTGQTEYTAILTQEMANYSTSLYNVISSFSVIFVYPGLYIPYTVENLFSFIIGIVIILFILLMFKDHKYKVLYILIYTFSIYFVSKITEQRFNIILFEPYRLLFIIPFLLYLVIAFIKKFKKYRFITFCFLFFVYSIGIYNFQFYYKDDLKEISKIAKEQNIKKIYSMAYNYNGNFNDLSLLKYYIKIDEIKNIPEDNSFYVFYRKMPYSNEFYLNKYNEFYDNLSYYRIYKLYDGRDYKLFRLVPKIRELK